MNGKPQNSLMRALGLGALIIYSFVDVYHLIFIDFYKHMALWRYLHRRR